MGGKGRVEKSDRWNVGQWRCARGSFSLCFSLCLSLPGPQLKRLKETGGERASRTHLPLSSSLHRGFDSIRLLENCSNDRRWMFGKDINCVWQERLFYQLPVVQTHVVISFHILLMFHLAVQQRSAGPGSKVWFHFYSVSQSLTLWSLLLL